jgi:hypothetical protein
MRTDGRTDMTRLVVTFRNFVKAPNYLLNTLNAKLNPIYHLVALLGARPILHVSRIRFNRLHKFI